MKILLVTHSYGLNGAAMLLSDCAKYWVHEKKWQVDALMSEHEYTEHCQELSEIGITPKLSVSGVPGEYDVALVNTLLDIEFVEKLAPNMPVVLWVHEGNTLLFNWDISLSKLTQGFAKCEKIIFQTTWQSLHVFKTFIDHLPSQRIEIVPSGVEIENVPQKTDYELNNKIRIITVGTVYPRKRQMDLVCVVDKIATKYPVELVIVGDYSQAIGWEHRIKTDVSNQNGHVKWLGGIQDRDLLNQLLVQSDLACFTSSDESHPLSLLEASICAVPMIISNLPTYSHIGWANNKNCLTFETGNLGQLEEQIIKLILDKNTRKRIATNAQLFAKKNFSKLTLLKKMSAILNGVKNKNGL